MIFKVIKRDGKLSKFEPDKLNKWAEWACSGLIGVNWSDVVTKAIKSGYDEMSTKELQKCLIDACISLVEKSSDYEKAAATLFLAEIRKEAFGSFTPTNFVDFYIDMVHKGLWEDMKYSVDELELFARHIDHDRDKLFPYSGLRQMYDKYLMKNKITDELYETPQFLYMGISMASMRGEPLADVIDFYDGLSKLKLNVPTPPLIGCRSPSKGFASCCLVSGGDSADSIEAAGHVIYQMVKNRSGIGVELETRSQREPVKNGLVQHNGKLNYYRMIDAITKSNTQEARGGSATMQYAFFDPEIDTLLRLRNPKTADESRIDQMDYSLALNKFFWQEYIKGNKIPLISPYYAPKTHKLFYGKDINAFISAYKEEVNKWKDKKVLKMKDGSMVSPVKWIDSSELLSIFAEQRSDTARIYLHMVDETNKRSTFKCPVRQSNLCLEIVEPSAPYEHLTDLYAKENINPIFGNEVTGEVALCNLGGIVINRIDNDEEYERLSYLLLKFVDNIIEMQTYPFPHMEFTSKNRRNAGIGIINLANALAEKQLSYASDEGRTFMHQQSERLSYFLHKASIRLAKEKGACGWYDKTTYSDGVLPIDNCNKKVDEHHNAKLMYDWEELRVLLKKYGIRNSVLEAYMPSESSSVTIGCTNGVEPIRQFTIIKSSRQGDIPQLAPDLDTLKYDYELAYDIPTEEYIKSMAVLQKFVGQSISTNVYYNLNNFENREIPLSLVTKHLMLAVLLGIKTLYYHNTDISIKNECENCAI